MAPLSELYHDQRIGRKSLLKVKNKFPLNHEIEKRIYT
jgi:hypothetical protein